MMLLFLQGLGILDTGIVVIYFLLILGVAHWVSRNNSGKQAAQDYFLASRSQGWLVVGVSLFASNIGSEIILGVSGAGARADMPVANFEILAALILILLGWVFVPFYLKSGVYTMPEFLEKRYSRSCRMYLSTVSILAYIITKISLIIFAGALVFEIIGIPFWTGAIFTVLLTGFYTVLGGLKAVIYTDMIQGLLLLAGTVLVTVFGLYHLGGWDELIHTLRMASIERGTPAPQNYFNLWRPMSDGQYPWTGMILGAPILGIWYWCTDQYIVQRVLSAKDESEARKGALFAGYLKLLPVFIFFIPGVIASALMFRGDISFSLDNADQALPALITGVLPVGLKGLAIAALLAALMSSLSSAFNSSSTLLTMDFYKGWYPDASEKQLVRFGQLATLVLVAVSLAWIPFMRALMGGGIFHYLQSIQAYISPPIASVFVFGLLFKWINGRGAIITLWLGFCLGMGRLVTEYLNNEGLLHVVPHTFLHGFVHINFLHFAFLLFLICSLALVVVSRFTERPAGHKVEGLTFGDNTLANFKTAGQMDIAATVLLVILVLAIWWLFSPLGLA